MARVCPWPEAWIVWRTWPACALAAIPRPHGCGPSILGRAFDYREVLH